MMKKNIVFSVCFVFIVLSVIIAWSSIGYARFSEKKDVETYIASPSQGTTLNETKVQTETETTSNMEKAPSLNTYSDIILQVTIAFLIMLFSISITIYVFLKSMIDRTKDEQLYAKRVMDIYNKETSFSLLYLTILSILLAIYSIVFYSLRFSVFPDLGLMQWVFGWLIPMASMTIQSAYFWKMCIQLDAEKVKIIDRERKSLEREISSIPISKEIVDIITDWIGDSKGADKMSHSDFIYLFSKEEELLLSDVDTKHNLFQNSNERIRASLEQIKYIEKQVDTAEKEDLKDSAGYKKIQKIKETFYTAPRDSTPASVMPDLYEKLEYYRNLLVLSERQNNKESQNFGCGAKVGRVYDKIPVGVEKQLFIFILQILVGFLKNSVFEEITYKAAKLKYADLYGARIENSIFIGALFEQAIVARIGIRNTDLSVSAYKKLHMIHLRIEDTSMINSLFEKVIMEDCSVSQTNLNNTSFINGKILKSDFIESDLSDTELINMELENNNYTGSKMWNLKFSGSTTIRGCTFFKADIRGWNFDMDKSPKTKFKFYCLTAQDFTKANMPSFSLVDIDASESIFEEATMYESSFQNVRFNGSIFNGANLTKNKFVSVNMEGAVFEGSNLYRAFLKNVNLDSSGLQNISASETKMNGCTLRECSCVSADFSDSKLFHCKFTNSDLRDANMSGALVRDCDFSRIRGKSLLCHKTEFLNCNFQESELEMAEFIDVKFVNCNFSYAHMKSVSCINVYWQDCDFQKTDLESARLINGTRKNCLNLNSIYSKHIKECSISTI